MWLLCEREFYDKDMGGARSMTDKARKLLILNLPYVILGLIATNFGEAWRLAEGADISEKLLALFGILPAAFQNPLPSFHPLDLLIGLMCGAALRLAVYLRGKNAKKYRHNVEYGSARWPDCGRLRLRQNKVLAEAEPAPVPFFVCGYRSERKHRLRVWKRAIEAWVSD